MQKQFEGWVKFIRNTTTQQEKDKQSNLKMSIVFA